MRDDNDVHRVLDARAVTAVYQPICDLQSGDIVGYEALGRGPAGSPLESPDALFAAAAHVDRVAELDWACRAAAYAGALRAALPAELTLFVNTEPAALDSVCPPDLDPVIEAAAEQLTVVAEFTERELAQRPAALLDAVAGARRLGWGVAVDDVGAEPVSLALLPFVHPDVVKLDLRLVQRRTDADVSGIVTAVLAHAERTGAAILAEGIETEEHRRIALAHGATLGQGWLYGRPAPLPAVLSPVAQRIPSLAPTPPPVSPYAAVSAARPMRRAEKRLLLSLSHHLENAAFGLGGATVVLSCFQDARHFTPATRLRYARLQHAAVLVAALGVDMAPEPVPGIRGGRLAADDPLAGEWTVVVVAPHYRAALVAKDCGDTGPESHRRFDYCVTHDPDLVLAAALSLLARVVPAPTLTATVPGQPSARHRDRPLVS